MSDGRDDPRWRIIVEEDETPPSPPDDEESLALDPRRIRGAMLERRAADARRLRRRVIGWVCAALAIGSAAQATMAWHERPTFATACAVVACAAAAVGARVVLRSRA